MLREDLQQLSDVARLRLLRLLGIALLVDLLLVVRSNDCRDDFA